MEQAEQEQQATGKELIEEIIRLSDFTFERLPMLDVIGERLVDNVALAFSELTHQPCEVNQDALDYIPLGKVLEDLPSPAIVATAVGAPLDGEILLVLDRTLLLTAIELILGAETVTLPPEKPVDFTPIERGFGERLFSIVLAELQRALLVISPSDLELQHVSTDPSNVSLGKSSSLCARIRLTCNLANQQGHLEVVIPYDSLETIRPDLGKVYFGDRSEDVGFWQEILKDQILRANLDLEVVLAREAFSLNRIMSWQPGDTIPFGIEEESDALMICSNQPMFQVSIGKRTNGFAAARIKERLSLEKEEEENGDDR